jgi:DNA (cytosine-5)-methyltransferase 3A
VTSLQQYLNLKNAGFEFDGQSYLFWEYIRVLRIVNPKYFLLENVKIANKWKSVFNSAIGVEPIQINSSLVSAQHRPRYYWTNIPDVKPPKDKNIKLVDILESDTDEIEDFMPCVRNNVIAVNVMDYLKPNGFAPIPCTSGFQDNKIGIIKSPCLRSRNIFTLARCKSGGVRRLTPIEFERLQTVPDGYTLGVSKTQRCRMLGNGWTVDVIAHILKNMI